MDATQQRFQLTELAPDVTTDEVLQKTAADIGVNLA
jgi:acyl CoA:acetate/3-ketoacid CoA transferase beta subunit